jgi:hypothetical protein
VFSGDLLNPDSFMRLVRLQDTLAAGRPVYIVMRDGGGGTLLHWSHFLDSFLLLLALPLRVFLPWPAALHGAAVAFGPLCIGCVGVAVAWAMAPLSLPGWRWTAPALAAMAPPVVGYAFPGVVHHHVPLGLAGVMMAGAAGRLAAGARGAGWTLGAAAAAGIWLSPEDMPLVLLAFGGGGLAWLVRPGVPGIGAGLAAAGSALLLLVSAAYAVDPPYAGYAAVEIDRLSIVYLGLGVAVCAIGWALWSLDRLGLARPWRGLLGGTIGIGGILLWIACFPRVILGTEGLDNAADAAAMNALVQEMLPVGSWPEAMALLFGGLLALLLLLWLAVSRRSLLWAYAAACVGLMLALGLLHIRFSTYPALAAACCLPVAVTEITRRLANHSPVLLPIARVGLLAVAMLATRADSLVGGPRKAPESDVAAPACNLRAATALLAGHAGEVVMSDPSDSPELLYRSQVHTVGSLYHRNAAAFMRLRRAWRSVAADSVPEAVRATGATLILVCPRPSRSLLVADLPPDTLLDRISHGQTPAWLEMVAGDGDGYALYRILP